MAEESVNGTKLDFARYTVMVDVHRVDDRCRCRGVVSARGGTGAGRTVATPWG